MKFITAGKLPTLEYAAKKVKSDKYGAIVTFSGTIRGTEKEQTIESISYESYNEMAEKELKKIVLEIKKTFNVSIFLKHKIGKIPVGEASLIVASAGVHRRETFLACEKVIDEIKAKVPIWKVKFE